MALSLRSGEGQILESRSCHSGGGAWEVPVHSSFPQQRNQHSGSPESPKAGPPPVKHLSEAVTSYTLNIRDCHFLHSEHTRETPFGYNVTQVKATQAKPTHCSQAVLLPTREPPRAILIQTTTPIQFSFSPPKMSFTILSSLMYWLPAPTQLSPPCISVIHCSHPELISNLTAYATGVLLLWVLWSMVHISELQLLEVCLAPCWVNTWQKHLEKGMIWFGSQFENTVCCGKKGKKEEVGDSSSHCNQSPSSSSSRCIHSH